MNLFKQWLSDIKQDPIIRKAALSVAGLAVVGGAIAGPATAAGVEPTPAQTVSTAVVQSAPAPPHAKTLDYQYQAQETFYYCGPAATRIALTALDRTPSQDEVAKHLGTTVNGTNSAEDVTRALKELGGKDYRTVSIPGPQASDDETNRMKSDIVRAISDGRAVVVNIQGTAVDTDGDAHSYPGGHYLTVVGYDEDGGKVTIADPYDPKGQYVMTIDTVADWAATHGYSA